MKILLLLLLPTMAMADFGQEFKSYYEWEKCEIASQVFSGFNCGPEPLFPVRACNAVEGNSLHMRDIYFPGGGRISFAELVWNGKNFDIKEIVK